MSFGVKHFRTDVGEKQRIRRNKTPAIIRSPVDAKRKESVPILVRASTQGEVSEGQFVYKVDFPLNAAVCAISVSA